MKHRFIVHGALYGDEGKGKVASSIAYGILDFGKFPMISMFTGGPQAAHNVVWTEGHHTHSQIGSGTQFGGCSFLDHRRMIDPIAFRNELEAFNSIATLHGSCYFTDGLPIITPHAWAIGTALEAQRGENGHSTCGFGIGLMWEASRIYGGTVPLSRIFPCTGGLDAPSRVNECDVARLQGMLLHIAGFKSVYDVEKILHARVPSVHYVTEKINESFEYLWAGDNHVVIPSDFEIWEGSQGIHLNGDMLGIPPYVSGGFHPFLPYGAPADNEWIVLVMRSYACRHGAGPLDGEPYTPTQGVDPWNLNERYKGGMRYAKHNVDMINKSIKYARSMTHNVLLVITHCDVLEFDTSVLKIAEDRIFKSYTPNTDKDLGLSILERAGCTNRRKR